MGKISIKGSPISITPASEGHAEIIAAIELKLASLEIFTEEEEKFVACQCKRDHNHHNNYHDDDHDNDDDNDEYDETL